MPEFPFWYTGILNTYNHTQQWGQTAIYCASAQGHSEVVKLLVQAEADLELSFKVYNIIMHVL